MRNYYEVHYNTRHAMLGFNETAPLRSSEKTVQAPILTEVKEAED